MFSTFQTWDEIGNWYSHLEHDRRVPTPEIRAQADEIVHGQTTDVEKVQALYEWVSRNIRYVSLSFGVGRYHPILRLTCSRIATATAKTRPPFSKPFSKRKAST